MNKKAQTGPIGMIFLVILFLINWFIWLADFIKDVGQDAITKNNITGVEAFFFSNLNFIIFLTVILSILAWGYFTAE